jgi:hypothetical protein
MDMYYNHDTTLNNLTDGQHTVKAYSRNSLGYEMAARPQTFTVQSNGKSGIFLRGFPNGYPSPISPSISLPYPYSTKQQLAELIPIIAFSSIALAFIVPILLKLRKSKAESRGI